LSNHDLLHSLKDNLNIWDKLTRVVVFLLLAAAVLGIALWYTPVIKQNERMRKERLELDKKLEKEEEISKKLDSSIKALQDPRTVERLAREKLSYAKPGETVIHFESPPTNSSPTQP
jgi:cell division protein FtsB